MTKTSEEWKEILLDGIDIDILDPDGWDRQNWQYSFKEEKITAGEFRNRVSRSTCMSKYGAFEKLNERVEGVTDDNENSEV